VSNAWQIYTREVGNGRYLGLHVIKLLPPSTKEYNYGEHADQTSSSLTKFIVNSISTYVSNKFIIKIYSITNLMVLILFHE